MPVANSYNTLTDEDKEARKNKHVRYWRLSKPSVAFCEDRYIAES